MRSILATFAITSFILAAISANRCAAGDNPESVVVDGEHFSVRQITDAKFNGLVAYRFSAPKSWRDSSEIHWNLLHINRPATVSMTVENPTNAEACFVFQSVICSFLPGPRAALREGQDGLDGLSLRPMQPAQALAAFIQKTRSQYPDLKFIGSRDLPGLAAAFHINTATTQHGIGEKVTYTLDGAPVEEEFYAVHYYQVVQGEALWGLDCLHSFRAPAGTLNRRRNVLAAIPKSFRMTAEFSQRAGMVKQQLLARYRATMRADAAEVNAARQRSAELTAGENQFLANVDNSLTASRASGAGAGDGAARTANDAQDDYIRGVVTMNDPVTGTSQHSLTEQYHWTDGYANYRNSNDDSYDPNKIENGDWHLMTPAQ